MQGKNWCFTINNYGGADLNRLRDLSCRYIIFGFETAPDTGTRHLQGFVQFPGNRRFNSVKEDLGNNAHIEKAKGTAFQAAEYCKKEGNFEERGEAPQKQGKRSDWERLREYLTELGRRPTERELINAFPGLFARYHKALDRIVSAMSPPPVLAVGAPRPGWQADLFNSLEEEPNDRTVNFVVDRNGNSGKSWFCRYMLTEKPDDVQVLRVGKRDDLALSIDPNKKIFLFDVPRQQMEFFQYSVVEQIKDRLVFSPKYNSMMKVLDHQSHIVVFSNEVPSMKHLTFDRYKIISI